MSVQEVSARRSSKIRASVHGRWNSGQFHLKVVTVFVMHNAQTGLAVHYKKATQYFSLL